MIGIAWWTGIAAGVAGVVAAYSGHWLVAIGLGSAGPRLRRHRREPAAVRPKSPLTAR